MPFHCTILHLYIISHFYNEVKQCRIQSLLYIPYEFIHEPFSGSFLILLKSYYINTHREIILLYESDL